MLFRDQVASKKIDLSEHGLNLNVFRASEREFSSGDRIVFHKNDRLLGIQNGDTGRITDIDSQGNMTVSTGKDNDITFNAHEYAYLDHGYAVTDYKALGQTTNITLYVADTRDKTNYNSFYVAATRGREDMYVFTNDKTELYEQVMIEQVKTSTLDFEKQLDLDKQELFKDTDPFEIDSGKVKNIGFEIAV